MKQYCPKCMQPNEYTGHVCAVPVAYVESPASDAAKAHEVKLVQRGRDDERARAIGVVTEMLGSTGINDCSPGYVLRTVLEKLRGGA